MWISIRSLPGKVDLDCPKIVATENETRIALKVSQGTEMNASWIISPQASCKQAIFNVSGE